MGFHDFAYFRVIIFFDFLIGSSNLPLESLWCLFFKDFHFVTPIFKLSKLDASESRLKQKVCLEKFIFAILITFLKSKWILWIQAY